jgi:hypothetical protein
MRALLEFLGLVRADPTRREPVALPAWARLVLPLIPLALALILTGTYLLARALLA